MESAKTSLRELPDGRLEMLIEHDLIRGVTPEMLYWWFTHIDGEMEYAGGVYSRYRVWHPLDHIDWRLAEPAPDGSAGKGARFHIQEAFARNPEHLVDVVDRIEKLDITGIRLVQRPFGKAAYNLLEHRWCEVEGGTEYRSQLLVGADSWFGRTVFNRVIRPRLFTSEMGGAWLRHNVEEVGNFENFLPDLYSAQARVKEGSVAAES